MLAVRTPGTLPSQRPSSARATTPPASLPPRSSHGRTRARPEKPIRLVCSSSVTVATTGRIIQPRSTIHGRASVAGAGQGRERASRKRSVRRAGKSTRRPSAAHRKYASKKSRTPAPRQGNAVRTNAVSSAASRMARTGSGKRSGPIGVAAEAQVRAAQLPMGNVLHGGAWRSGNGFHPRRTPRVRLLSCPYPYPYPSPPPEPLPLLLLARARARTDPLVPFSPQRLATRIDVDSDENEEKREEERAGAGARKRGKGNGARVGVGVGARARPTRQPAPTASPPRHPAPAP